MKSTKWFARRLPRGGQLTRNRKTTASCTVTDSRIWMGTFGSWPSWSRAQLSLREVQWRSAIDGCLGWRHRDDLRWSQSLSRVRFARREHMQPQTHAEVTSKKKLWIGRLISALTVAFLLFDTIVKVLNLP